MNNILTAKNPIEKRREKLTFNTIWQKYGTIGILVILLGILAAAKPNVFFSANTVPQLSLIHISEPTRRS